MLCCAAGVQCSLEQVARVGAELGVVETRQLAPALLTYSPPSHYSTGIHPHITDPFEDNTVSVRAGNEPSRSFTVPQSLLKGTYLAAMFNRLFSNS